MPVAFSGVNLFVISTEFSMKPKNSSHCEGMKVDVAGCATNPKESTTWTESITLPTHSWYVFPCKYMSSRYALDKWPLR